MARAVNRLSARRVQTLTERGRHADGGGLYLVVDDAGAKRWVLLYRIDGRRREMGLGSVISVSLARAREVAAEAREQIAGGVDPIEARRTPPKQAAPAVITFGSAAESFMNDRESVWRNAQHRWQWRQTLEHQTDGMWDLPVSDVGTDEVLKALRPIWHVKPETARRLRGRIERVLDAARAAGQRTGDNPARWRGHLEAILPRAKRLSRGHHPAMPWAEVPEFVSSLRQRPAVTARALEFIILTASRSGEVRGMRWPEVDPIGALWTVPDERMKMKRPHRVPLPAAALAILAERALEARTDDDLVFASPTGGMLSDMAFEALLRRAEKDAVTTHGFRSSFRDWAADETDHPREVIEAALAHLVGDETERAYRRGDALEKRRLLMDHWAAFVGKGSPAAK
ncbi:integrase arm-type DNA-binding domain-containing protein [Methylobacterium sp. C25]|uniref:tyrosine-type recombinase/integrase n=1 Tax=Methylobacterium sp. C25 TaxID=2721622 RepID=UPI001F247828|nr:site-specific integrase [Methylobacterium sp. C25]MCE4223455.1 integrase arm-type DNA-binding domain-containing protein [Methylobacterium sp. C25]